MKKIFSLTILFLIMAYSLVSAGDLKLYSIGPKLGFIMPEDPWDSGLLIGARANLGELFTGGKLMPFAQYWSSGYEYAELNQTEDISLSNIQIGADLGYFIESAPGLYVGGGLSINIISVDVPGYSVMGVTYGGGSDSETKIGIDLMGGYQMPIGKNTGFVEAKYNIISDFNTFEIGVGLLFDLAK
jgi:opacity protein-like surface antigen